MLVLALLLLLLLLLLAKDILLVRGMVCVVLVVVEMRMALLDSVCSNTNCTTPTSLQPVLAAGVLCCFPDTREQVLLGAVDASLDCAVTRDFCCKCSCCDSIGFVPIDLQRHKLGLASIPKLSGGWIA